MFYTQFKDVKTLNRFLSISEIDFIDAFVDNGLLKLIISTSEVYAEFSVHVQCSAEQDSVQFRISKKLLQFIIEDDILEFTITNGMIHLSIKDYQEALRYECSFIQQIVEFNVYYDKMNIAKSLEFVPSINTTKLVSIFKIAAASTGVVNCDGGAASVLTKEGPRVYYRTEPMESFSLTCKAFGFLRKCSSDVMNYRDFLIAKYSAFVVIVRKTRLQTNEEFQFLISKRFGAQYVADVNFNQLFRFLSKTKIQVDAISIGLSDFFCTLEAMNASFKVPIQIANIQTTGNLRELAIPTSVLNKLLMNVGSVEFRLRVTKYFVQLTTNQFYVVW